MNTKKLVITAILSIAGMLAFAWGVKYLDNLPSRARKCLPASATDINEHYHGSFNGDFTRVLKARLPMADYPQYAKNLKLDARVNNAGELPQTGFYVMPRLSGIGLNWWDPPDEWNDCYYSSTSKGSSFTSILWSNGWVYLYATSM